MNWVRNILFLSTLAGCMPAHRYVGKDMTPSESACLDGTLVNISGAGCKMYYLGNNPGGNIKMRCTYTKVKNIWTEYSFVAIGAGADDKFSFREEGWELHCVDKYVIMYTKLEK